MYAVYYTVSDGCTFSSDTIMFVTESAQTAKDACTLAELEYAEALKVPRVPSLFKGYNPGMSNDEFEAARIAHAQKTQEYNEKIKAILTVHPDRAEDFSREDDNSYYYERVEVR